MSGPPLVAAVDLTAGYAGRQGRRVLERITLELRSGELVAVLGPNGAGKSTLLGTLAGRLPALAGRVELLGRDLATMSPRRLARLIGVVLPQRVVPGMLSAYRLVALGRYPHTDWSGRLRPRDGEVVHRVMESVGVTHLADREVAELSDGERQKVMIARALAQEPLVMILDEPTAFLDLPGRVEVMSLLGRLARRGDAGGAVLLSTHDLDLALRAADRVWLLDHQGGLRRGTPEELVRGGALEDAFASSELGGYLPDPESLGRLARGRSKTIGSQHHE